MKRSSYPKRQSSGRSKKRIKLTPTTQTTKKSPPKQQQITPPSITQQWGRFYKMKEQGVEFGEFSVNRQWLREEQDKNGNCRVFLILRYLNNENKKSYQLFYRSSGHNSLADGTWFPCNGYTVSQDESDMNVIDETYSKLYNTKFSKSLKENTELINDLVKLGNRKMTSPPSVKQSLLLRFGTLRFLYASYLMGGGIWENENLRMVFSKHLGLDLSRSYSTEEQIQFHWPSSLETCRVIENPHIDVNSYAHIAISTNFCKEEYKDPVTKFIDLTEWVKGEIIEIGVESPLNKSLRRFKGKLVECPRQIPIFVNSVPYIPEILLYYNLDTMNCDQFDRTQLRYSKLIKDHLKS
jgi:hypothetical protein